MQNSSIKVFAFTALFVTFFDSSAWAQSYKEYRRDHLYMDAMVDYFNSTANYGSDGGLSSLGSDQSFQLTNVLLSTRYMPKKTWALYANAVVGNAESQNSIAKRSTSTLTQGTLGLDWVMYNDTFQIIADVSATVPFITVDRASDSALNGEGVSEYTGKLLAQTIFGRWLYYTWAGVQLRGEGRSTLLPYGIGVSSFGRGFNFGAEVFGTQSISDDKNKDLQLTREAYLRTVNGGSFKFYSVNPNILDSQLFVGYRLSREFRARVFGGTTLIGANAAAGYHVGVGFTYLFDFSEGYSELAPEVRDQYHGSGVGSQNSLDEAISSEKDVKKFKEDTTDGVDQKIFKASPTPKPKAVKKGRITPSDRENLKSAGSGFVELEEPVINPKGRRRNVEDAPDIQTQMDEADFSVELKPRKK